MFPYLTKRVLWQIKRGQSYALFLMLLIVSIISGCNSRSSKQTYENPEFGISFERPKNWSVEYDERTRSIALKAEVGMWKKEMARIDIMGVAISPSPYVSEQELKANIDRIRILYNLDSVNIVQEPTIIENEDYEIATATILIATTSLPKDSPLNQFGVQEPGTFQRIDMWTIKCTDNFALVYVYKGSNEQLNTEAEAIVDSIELVCSDDQ